MCWQTGAGSANGGDGAISAYRGIRRVSAADQRQELWLHGRVADLAMAANLVPPPYAREAVMASVSAMVVVAIYPAP